jgi:hypothetical protein
MATKFCFTPGQAGAPRWLCIRTGRIVEWVVRREYCSDRNPCDEFQLGGSGVDFFDENFAGSGTTRCRFLSGYLVAHHPTLDESFISSSCEVKKKPVDPSDDENERFAIPDVITDLPGVRTEFYEVKPNSVTGVAAGRLKVATFLSLVDFLKQTDPTVGTLAKGIQFKPDRSITFYSRLYLGFIPVEVQLHYFRLEDGLIVYEICVTAQTEIAEALATAVIVGALIFLAYWFFKGIPVPEGDGLGVPGGGAPVLADSVGPSGNNDTQDVRYVQALLNDWLGGTGNSLIAVSDTVSDEMAGALSSFQQGAGLDDTAGSVAPGDVTITALQQAHFDGLVAAMDISDLGLEDAGSFIAQETPELVDTEGGDEPVTQTAFAAAAAQYLQLMHDNA